MHVSKGKETKAHKDYNSYIEEGRTLSSDQSKKWGSTMRTLVLYDSAYGNTELIARSIGRAIGGDVKVLRIGEVNPGKLEPVDLLIAGSPTQGAKPTKAMQEFLNKVPQSVLENTSIAAFDTRYSGRLVAIFGFAAEKIADSLKAKGAALASAPAGFFVNGKEGPLKEGELERAALWAKTTAGILSLAEGEDR